MTFSYNPKDAERAWPEGYYPAEIKDVTPSVSKSSQQPMLVLTYVVFDDQQDRQQELKDYITKASTFKLKQLAKALGQLDDFNAGTFDAEAWALSRVSLYLTIENDPQYGDKNRIQSINPVAPAAPVAPVVKKPVAKRPPPTVQPAPSQTVPAIPEDDIPF